MAWFWRRKYFVLVAAVLAAAAFWFGDALVDSLVFREGPYRAVVWDAARADFWDRALAATFLVAAGAVLQAVVRRRRETDLEIRRERDHAQAYLDVAGVVMLALDTKGRAVKINRKGCELLGFPEAEILGRDWFAAFLPERVRDDARRVFDGLIAGNGAVGEYFENSVAVAGGGERLVAWHNAVVRDERGFIVGTLSSGEDITDQRRMENTLRESEDKYRRLFESGGDAVLVHEIATDGTPGRFLEVNDAACLLYGRPREELLTLTPADVRDPDAAVNQADVGAVLSRDKSAVFERRVVAADGRATDVEVNAHVIDFRGRPAVLAVCRDVTARKEAEGAQARAEEALRAANEQLETRVRERTKALAAGERFLASVFASITDGLNILDMDMVNLRVNKVMEEWYAHAMPLVGKKCYEAYHGRSEPCEVCPSVKTLRTGETAHEVVPMRGPGGAITGWIDLFSYPLVDQETGAMQGAIEYVRDITAQRRAEEALAEQQWIRENVLDHMNEVIYIVDHDTHEILFVNAAARALLGEGLVGRKCYEAVWSLAAPCHDCGIVALLAGAGASFSREAFSERAGKWLAADVRAVPWLDGRTVFSHVASDTTERKALEEEIIAHNISLNKTVRERTAALEAKNRELEAFAYSVSHDLRAPLRSMEGFSQALLEDYGDRMEAEARHYLERIANGATRLDLLINDLLQYSRLGRNGVAFEPVDTNDVVRGCLDDLREELAASRGAVEVAGPLPTVVADRSLLAILVQNLLANALLYHRDGVPPSVRVSCEERDGAYVFAVADNGLGLDAKYADKAFNMFQRFHAGDKYPGTGIGLANARKVVEAHGGRIWFESTVGEGTTFFFALPVREAGELVAATED